MQTSDRSAVLDWDQFRDITLDDGELMREILTALIDDTSRQIPLMESAILEQDSQRCARLAHYSKGACANVGAAAAAELLKTMEYRAANRQFRECSESLRALGEALDLLRSEARCIAG